MTGWEVQQMWERDAAALWEKLNAPDPCEKQLIASSKDLGDAIERLDKAEDALGEAMAELYDTPMEDVVGSFLDQISDIKISIRLLKEKYERGQRE